MKKLIFAVMAVMVMAAPMANAQKVNKDATLAKLAKADADVADAKKGSKAATWINRGKAYYAAAAAPTKDIFVDMPLADLELVLGKADATNEGVTLGSAAYTELVYPWLKIYMTDGKISTWVLTQTVKDEDLAAVALDSYNKAYEMDNKTVGKLEPLLKELENYYSQKGNVDMTATSYASAAYAYSQAYKVQESPAFTGAKDPSYLYYAGYLYTIDGATNNASYATGADLLSKALEAGYADADGNIYYYLYHCYYGQTDSSVRLANLQRAKDLLMEGLAKFPKNTRFKLDSNTANKYVDVRFMMPGSLLTVDRSNGSITGGDYFNKLKMHIYTDNGVYTIPDVVQAITFSNTTDYEVRGKVLARNASYSLTLSKEAVIPGEENFIVTTVEDWNNLVDEYGASTNYGSSNPLSVQIIGDDFSFNGDVKYPSKAYFKVETDAKVTGNVTIKHVIFDNNTTITVDEDATLTTDATLNIRNAEIENNGTVNIAPVAANQEPYRISEITNNGTLNIAEKSVARFRLVNEKNGKVENAGEIATYGENKGEINNKGMIETIAFFYNDRRTEWKNNKEVVIYEGTINNNGTIRSTAGRIYNGSIINNNGRLTCQSLGGTIENEYRLYSAKGATTYITINNATVVVEEAIPNNSVVITTQSGKVQYTAVNATENFKSGSVTSIVNSVIAKGDLTISNLGNVNALTINGAATLKLPAKAKIATVNANANTVLASDLEVTSMLKVAANTTVKVNAGVTLDVNSMDNDGVIDVAGTFTANMSGNEPGAGVVEESFGNNSQVIWEKNPANQAAKTYQTAINAAVKAWAQDGNLSTATVNVLSYNLKAKNAATTFEAYVNGTTSAANTELKDAYDAYRRVESGVTLTSGYNAAVTELMKRESEKTFTEMVKTLTYTDIVIYENASKALEGFKAAVAGNRVGGISTQLDKVVICTSTTNYAPEQSQIKKSDVIYTIFGDDAINLVSDWTSILSRAFDHSISNASAWNVDVVKDWISRVASTSNADSSLILEAAKDFITTNNLLQASRGWKYTPEQIQAVLLEQEYNK